MSGNPYRAKIVRGYRERLLKVLTSDDLRQVILSTGNEWPHDALQARYNLLGDWENGSPLEKAEIKEKVLEQIGRFLDDDVAPL